LLKFLRPLEHTTDFRVWHDQQIQPGANWQEEIDAALTQADIAILFVSADYLASEWILQKELPQLLERQQRGEIHLLPIIVRPAAWVHTPLAYLQVWPHDGRALSDLSEFDRDRLWNDFAKVLVAVLHRLAEPPMRSPVERVEGELEIEEQKPDVIEATEEGEISRGQEREVGSLFFISHAKEDGDFTENLKFRMTEAGFTGWIDIDVLEAGTDWRKEIDEAILSSCAIILVLSPDSKTSEYVTYEWAFGLGAGLRVVPLLLRDTPIHPRLEAFQYLDFTNRRARPWNRLFALLRGLLATREQA
jgi:TIR domain